MTKWVQEKLEWTPEKCIIYGGLFDIKEGQSLDSVFDSLDMLVSELKKKNIEMKICVSLLAPSIESGLLSKCVNEFNEQIIELASNNNIMHAETELSFKDKNNAIEKTCYVDNGSLLNKEGVIRLLEAWCIGQRILNACELGKS